MKFENFCASLLLCLMILPLAHSKGSFPAPFYRSRYVPNEIIVKVRPEKIKDFMVSTGVVGVRVARDMRVSFGSFYVMKIENGQGMEEALKQVRALSYVEYAEPNYIYHALAETPNDPFFDRQWGLANTGFSEPDSDGELSRNRGVAGNDIGALKAWDITRGSKKVKIAIIDTGVDYTHADLADNIWVNEKELNGAPGVDDDGNGYIDDVYGYDFYNDDGYALDDNGHGTHCTGIIGARHNNELGVAGVMNDVTIVPLKFLGSDGSGSSEMAIKAIDYATNLNVDIMSNSWGGIDNSLALKEAIARARDKGIIFVAAAGNDGTNNDVTPMYPASYDLENVVAVGAIDAQESIAEFSNFGKKSVLLGAPGVNVISTVPNERYEVYSGTSMATPYVSGALGLLISKTGRLPHAKMKERLIQTSTKVSSLRSRFVSGGRLNAYNLLKDIRTPVPTEPDERLWRPYMLSKPFEGRHPYPDNENLFMWYTVPGAKFVRAIVKKYDMERGYDFLNIRAKTPNAELIDSLSGTGVNYHSVAVEGDSIMLQFVSDGQRTGWGFAVEALEYIK